MKKTLLKRIPEKTPDQPVMKLNEELKSELLADLVQDMKPFLQEAAADLLKPRPEFMAQLFQRVLN